MQIKGIREGIMVTLGEGSWTELQESLLQQVYDQSKFFHGARLAIDVGNQKLHAADLAGLRDRLSEREISLWAVLSNNPATEQNAQALGLATRLFNPKPERTIRTQENNLNSENGVMIYHTIRSGGKLMSLGHVTVIGDINPGAEIIAGGSIVVWGRLRGVVHAGSEGNDQAMVCALDLSPTQLRIAGIIAVPPQKRGKRQPEIARIINGQVVAEQWDHKGK